jgi:hypothetical protein
MFHIADRHAGSTAGSGSAATKARRTHLKSKPIWFVINAALESIGRPARRAHVRAGLQESIRVGLRISGFLTVDT